VGLWRVGAVVGLSGNRGVTNRRAVAQFAP
jgi:hypothetical protein